MLLKVLACIKFLARQGLPLCGHDDDSDSNLIQLLEYHGEEDKELLKWLHKKSNKYTCHEIQNELIRYSHFINFFRKEGVIMSMMMMILSILILLRLLLLFPLITMILFAQRA